MAREGAPLSLRTWKGAEPRYKGARRKDREASRREATVEATPLSTSYNAM